MTRYSFDRSDRIFVKGYGFLCFPKTIGKNILKSVSNNLSGTYIWKRRDNAPQSTTNTLEAASKIAI